MSEPDDAPETGYELAMPFVLVESNGGTLDDTAFVAGYTCGSLDHELGIARHLGALPSELYLDTALLKQVDLIAMRHGYLLHLGDIDPDSGCQAISFEWA